MESIMHIFVHCDWARCVWLSCPLAIRFDMTRSASFEEWFQFISRRLQKQQIKFVVALLWFIWFHQNKLVYEQVIVLPHLVGMQAHDFLKAFCNAVVKNVSTSPCGAADLRRWQPSNENRVKFPMLHFGKMMA